jgi:hypothetical protein
MAQGGWPKKARAALLKVCTQTQLVVSTGVQLLDAIRGIFNKAGADRLITQDILEKLVAIDDGPWAWMFEEALNHDKLKTAGAKLARMLGKYKAPDGKPIKPRNMKTSDGSVLRGYHKVDFKAAWDRYLAPLSVPVPGNDATDATYLAKNGSVNPVGSVTETLPRPAALPFSPR